MQHLMCNDNDPTVLVYSALVDRPLDPGAGPDREDGSDAPVPDIVTWSDSEFRGNSAASLVRAAKRV